MSMKHLILFILIFSAKLGESNTTAFAINPYEYYKAFSSSDMRLVDSQLSLLSKSEKDEFKAFSGAMLMKKSSLVGSIKDKLVLFNKGKKLLEEGIEKDPSNCEYRFLRLAIQENCPPFLEYNKDMQADSKKISENFKTFSPEAKAAIREYSKTSKVLHINDLN